MSGYADLAGIVRFAALQEPIGGRGTQVASPFSAPWTHTVELLAREIKELRPEHALLEVDVPASRIRQDGLPRADARAASAGVRLTLLGTKHGTSAQAKRGRDLIRQHGSERAAKRATHPDAGGREEDFLAVMAAVNAPQMRYQCWRFNDWQDNVRAIALGMEALRKVDRYAITEAGQQYAGFMQLASGA